MKYNVLVLNSHVHLYILSSIVWIAVCTVHTHCKENPISVLRKKKLRGLSSNFHIHILRAIYIYSRSAHLFFCSRIGKPFVGIQGLRPHSFISGNICLEFLVYCLCSAAQSTEPGLDQDQNPQDCANLLFLKTATINITVAETQTLKLAQLLPPNKLKYFC